MSLLRKANLGIRLTLSYAFTVIVITVLCVVAVVNLNRLSDESRNMFLTDVYPLNILNDISADSFYMIESITNAVLFSGDPDLMQEYVELYGFYKEKIVEDMNAYEAILEENRVVSDQFVMMEAMYENDFVPMLDAAMEYALDKVQPDDVGLFLKLNVIPTSNAFMDLVQDMYNDHTDHAEIVSGHHITLSSNLNRAMYIILPVAVALTSLLMYFVTKSVSKPVRQLVDATNEIAMGNLDVNLPHSGDNDEVGMLTTAFLKMKETLNQLTHEMDGMAESQSKGDVNAFIQVAHFDGKFQDIATKINEMTKARLDVTTQIMSCISKMGEGDFDAPLDCFSGGLSQINNTIESLRGDLKNVHSKISTLIIEAVKGDLSARIDTSQLKGDWKKLADEINALLNTITEPIYEVQEVLEVFSEGDLNVRMSKEYKGDYDKITKAINASIETIHSYVREVTLILKSLADQNLDVEIDRHYIGDFQPMKDAINHIIKTLNKMLGNINDTSLRVGQHARAFTESSRDLATGAEEQAQSVKTLAVALEEISKKAVDASDVAANAKNIIEGTAINAKQGSKEMTEMLSVVEEINSSSNVISGIIQIIDSIAFQTNLLSLNASVEAARAGEHGKGFAVVADEVRNLAISSQKAASDISRILDESMSLYQSSTSVARQTALSFETIMDDISVLANLMADISTATNEQRHSIEEINDSLVQISHITGQVSVNSMEEAAMSEKMSEQADFLIQQIMEFSLAKEK